ncbi:uncharacterized protein si:cabz01071907.1 [Danio aesculapii]|uniref:uncharacterized protein si:cabz01071907.1 n=1 Tax=Danio aesculapii TaxID=1142201 RepID=UPI0024BFD5FF|nr:uncharacterized protein si:cabz01071907.1 [Danio aesculapii]
MPLKEESEEPNVIEDQIQTEYDYDLATLKKSPSDSETEETSSQKSAETTKTSSSFICTWCGKSFSELERFKVHMKVHTGEGPFSCRQCGKRFTLKSRLKMHITIHTGEKSFICPQCGKTFTRKGSLKVHMRIHSGETSFPCKHCGKSFTQKGSLKVHMRIHSGESSFTCQHCGKSFTQKGSLKVHMRIHTGESSFLCKHCGKSFTQKGSLKVHMRIHSGESSFTCQHCGKSFTQKGSLEIHMRTHTGENLFICPDCGKSFHRKESLTSHMRIHTGKKPLSCELCGKSFRDSHSSNTAQSSCKCCCSVPCCSNNKQRFPYLSFHDFPVDTDQRARWIKAVKINKGPSFKILRGSTYVCSQHFAPEDKYMLSIGRTRIKKGAVPSRFFWNNWGEGTASENHLSVNQRAKKYISAAYPEESQESQPANGAVDHDYAYHPSPGKLDAAAERIKELELQVSSLEEEIKQLTVKQQQPLIYKFCVTDEDFQYYTKFSSKQAFTAFWESVHPSDSRLAYWTKAQQTETPNPEPELPLVDELFLFLCRVVTGLQEKTLSSIFEVSLVTVNRVILTWTSYLHQVLESLPLWMSREQVQATMPDKTKLVYPQLRVILHCTEISCEAASIQSETLKDHTNFKALIGISPCGVVTFVSKLYPGSISDAEITHRSHIVQLLQPGDKVMADEGFQIEEILSEVGATLLVPPLEDNLETQAIAQLRGLVNRTIRRVKEYQIWDGVVPLSLAGLVSQLWAVCCLMVNYQGDPDAECEKPV